LPARSSFLVGLRLPHTKQHYVITELRRAQRKARDIT
jgi:hypothetical protein